MSRELIEMAVADFCDEPVFQAAHHDFEARCGEFQPTDPWFEERIAYLYTLVALMRDQSGGSPMQRCSTSMKLPEESRNFAKRLCTAQRGLYFIGKETGVLVATDAMRGGRFRLEHEPLLGAEVFDGFLYGTGEGTRIAPGAIFYPPTARDAIQSVAMEARRLELSVDHTCDALLRMKMRGERTERMDPAIAFRADALDAMNTSSAGWRVAESAEVLLPEE